MVSRALRGLTLRVRVRVRLTSGRPRDQAEARPNPNSNSNSNPNPHRTLETLADKILTPVGLGRCITKKMQKNSMYVFEVESWIFYETDIL